MGDASLRERPMRRCPQCAEKIQSAAVRCRYCSGALPKTEGRPNKAVLWGMGMLAVLLMFSNFISSPERAQPEQLAPIEQPLPAKWRLASNDRATIFTEVDRRIQIGTPESTAMALGLLKDKFGAGPMLFDPAIRPTRDRAKKANDEAIAASNKPQIDALLHKEKLVSRDDLAGRLAIWRKLAALAPGSETYNRTADELNEKIEAPRRAAAREQHYREHPQDAVIVAAQRWQKSGFGAVMIADFTLENASNLRLRDFRIECEVRGNSKTIIDTKSITLFEELEPRETKIFYNVNVGFIPSQAARAYCHIVGAKIN